MTIKLKPKKHSFSLIGAILLAGQLLLSPGSFSQEEDLPNDQSPTASESGQQDSNPNNELNTADGPPPSLFQTNEQLENYVDGVVDTLRQKDKLPGVTLSVVHNGKIILAKGYGFAHLGGEEELVNPERTMFRIGSISKTFTYISLMQMVEQGKLTLDTVVNTLLPETMKIPDQGYENPILVWHLMTHSAGFEDSALGHLFWKDVNKVPSLETYLKAYPPARVREPGVVASYSNYSLGIAGYIISSISGKTFETYVEENIFMPLQMETTTFREPLTSERMRISSDLENKISTGFKQASGWWEDAGFEYISNIGPAGAASSTANDMARFMLSLLNKGELEGGKILNTETTETMRQTLFSNGPGYLPGLAHGFMTGNYGEFEAFGHGGDTMQFHSQMMMIPELSLGVFASTNLTTGGAAPRQIVKQIIEYMDERAKPADTPKPPENFITDGQKFAGSYLSTRRGYSTMEKFFTGFLAITKLSITKDGYLLANGNTRYVQTGPLTFRKYNDNTRVVFKEDENGKIVSFSSGAGLTAAVRVSFWEEPKAFQIFIGLMLITAVGSVIGAWLRRHYDIRQSIGESFAGGLMPLTSFFWLIWAGIFGKGVLDMIMAGNNVLFSYPSTLLEISVWFGGFVVLLSVINVFAVWNIWSRGRWPMWRRLRHTLGALIFATMAMLLNIWNLVGFGML